MTTLYLVRHAEAEGNLYRRIHGWYDALVTDNGFRPVSYTHLDVYKRQSVGCVLLLVIMMNGRWMA